MSDEISTATKRGYTLRKRAQAMAATRRRITEAAVELHGTVGPARTTISAVAERAGVQRHTIYRHFPTEDELYAACSAHFFSANPWPDAAAWSAIADPAKRLAQALDELYAYYERTEAMLANVLRDEALVPSVTPALAPFRAFLDFAGDVLASGRRARGRRAGMLAAATRHGVEFQTWCSLARDGGLSRPQAVELATAMVEHADR